MIIVPGGVLMGAEASGSARPKLASTDELVDALAALPDPLCVLKAVRDPAGTATELVCVLERGRGSALWGTYQGHTRARAARIGGGTLGHLSPGDRVGLDDVMCHTVAREGKGR